MEHKKALNTLSEGEKARIVSIKTSGSMRRRLFDLGMIEGTVVECLQKSPFGDPVAYLIRGAVLALRGNDSQKIVVKALS